MDTFVILSLAVAYSTYVLLLRRKSSHFGPFQSETKVIMFDGQPGHVQPVTLFDWVRRLFGVYDVKGDVWTVNEIRSQRWTCPYCLSFWIALPFAALMSFFTANLIMYPVYVLAMAAVASAVNEKLYG